jgi:DeoR/GlpR family transcriptional regulator of sugar metabolism
MTRVRRNERQQQILAELRLSPHVRISALAERFGVSTETVRRDVDMLSEQGLVARAYGGAAAAPIGVQPPFGERNEAQTEERIRIAERAAALVQPGEVLMIDAGSTTSQFARRLAVSGRDLTVLTNSLPVASALGSNETIDVILCPGDYSPDEAAVFGTETIAFLQRFRADTTFIGASGLSVDGIMDANRSASVVKRAMLAQADTRYLLVDHTKFNQRKLSLVEPLGAIDAVITNCLPDSTLVAALSEAEVTLYAAAEAGAQQAVKEGKRTGRQSLDVKLR